MPGHRAEINAAIARAVPRTDGRHEDRAARPRGERLAVAMNELKDRGPDGAETGHTDAQGRGNMARIRGKERGAGTTPAKPAPCASIRREDSNEGVQCIPFMSM